MYVEKKDPDALYLTVKVRGAEIPGATFSQLLGKHKLSAKKIGEDVKKVTAAYSGNKVCVTLAVKDRNATVHLNPTTAQMLINALGEKRAPRKKGVEREIVVHNGDLTFQKVVEVAHTVRDTRSNAKTLRKTLKEILGCGDSIGFTIEGKKPKEVSDAVAEGKMAVAELFGKGEEVDTFPDFLDEQ